MIRTIPKKFCITKKTENFDIHGTQAHCGFPDEGGIWITAPDSRGFRFDMGTREELEALKEVIDFVLKRKPQTYEEHQEMMRKSFGHTNINVSIEEQINEKDENK